MRSKVTYANVVATLALFLALGGASYAALKLPKNSVGTKQIRTGAVTGNKVAAHTLTGANIDLSMLGVVPDAVHSAHADAAASATRATTAGNADMLGGQPASAFAPAGPVQVSGLLRVPTDGNQHAMFTRPPLTFGATCTSSGGNSTLHMNITPSEDVIFIQKEQFAQPVMEAGKTEEIDNGVGTGTFFTVTPFSVIGPDGMIYDGSFTLDLNVFGVPCGMSVVTIG